MFHVKHSVEQEPSAAAQLFGDRIDLARAFAADLEKWGEELGLVGPRELERLWTRHIVNSALLGTLITGESVVDVGSGAGFPGLVLAIMRPDIHFTLVEPMERRATWLSEETVRLGLNNVTVVRARAQDVPPSSVFDTVTARAVSALKTLVPMTLPLVKPGGSLVFLKGEKVREEIQAARSVLTSGAFDSVAVEEVGPEWGTEMTRVFVARTIAPAKPAL